MAEFGRAGCAVFLSRAGRGDVFILVAKVAAENFGRENLEMANIVAKVGTYQTWVAKFWSHHLRFGCEAHQRGRIIEVAKIWQG